MGHAYQHGSRIANRLRKNAASLGAWAKREGIACYRVYDADMPEYAFSIDVYADGVDAGAQRWLYVQEYAPPATVDPAKARARREEAFAVIPETLGIARERVHLRTRRKQKGGAQYSKLGQRGEFEGAHVERRAGRRLRAAGGTVSLQAGLGVGDDELDAGRELHVERGTVVGGDDRHAGGALARAHGVASAAAARWPDLTAAAGARGTATRARNLARIGRDRRWR